MKSSTIAIRNRDKQVDRPYLHQFVHQCTFHEFVAEFFPTPQQVERQSPETFANSVEELAAQTVDNTIDEINRDPSVANKRQEPFYRDPAVREGHI